MKGFFVQKSNRIHRNLSLNTYLKISDKYHEDCLKK